MNEEQRFEMELRRVRPARPPAEFMARLRAAQPSRESRQQPEPVSLPPLEGWVKLLRWFVPATAVVVAAAGLWWAIPRRVSDQRMVAAPTVPALKVDEVQIDRELVASFDAIARLPSGEPVRFHCRKWMDQVVWQDREKGLVVQRRTPRIEVVPVRFETY